MLQAQSSRSVVNLGAIALAISGLLFLGFPVVRPFFETSPDPFVVAQGFASTNWVVAHMLGMGGFILLPLGFFGLYEYLRPAPIWKTALSALVITWIGAGLVLPYFGAEAFGLQVIGQQALVLRRTDVAAVANTLRFGPAIFPFGLGLILVAIGAILAAIAVWRSRDLPKWSAVLLAIGFALYIPQFLTTQPVRVAHGLLIAAGAIWLSVVLLRASSRRVLS
jgi:hypothetical protein